VIKKADDDICSDAASGSPSGRISGSGINPAGSAV
jgi:hypothetical protein